MSTAPEKTTSLLKKNRGNNKQTFVQLHCSSQRTTSVCLAVLVKTCTKVNESTKNLKILTIEQWAIVAHVESHQLTSKIVARLRGDELQKVEIVVSVKSRHVFKTGQSRTKHLQLLVQSVVQNQIVRQSNAMRLHRMSLKTEQK
jgi:hypothetical protein